MYKQEGVKFVCSCGENGIKLSAYMFASLYEDESQREMQLDAFIVHKSVRPDDHYELLMKEHQAIPCGVVEDIAKNLTWDSLCLTDLLDVKCVVQDKGWFIRGSNENENTVTKSHLISDIVRCHRMNSRDVRLQFFFESAKDRQGRDQILAQLRFFVKRNAEHDQVFTWTKTIVLKQLRKFLDRRKGGEHIDPDKALSKYSMKSFKSIKDTSSRRSATVKSFVSSGKEQKGPRRIAKTSLQVTKVGMNQEETTNNKELKTTKDNATEGITKDEKCNKEIKTSATHAKTTNETKTDAINTREVSDMDSSGQKNMQRKHVEGDTREMAAKESLPEGNQNDSQVQPSNLVTVSREEENLEPKELRKKKDNPTEKITNDESCHKEGKPPEAKTEVKYERTTDEIKTRNLQDTSSSCENYTHREHMEGVMTETVRSESCAGETQKVTQVQPFDTRTGITEEIIQGIDDKNMAEHKESYQDLGNSSDGINGGTEGEETQQATLPVPPPRKNKTTKAKTQGTGRATQESKDSKMGTLHVGLKYNQDIQQISIEIKRIENLLEPPGKHHHIYVKGKFLFCQENEFKTKEQKLSSHVDISRNWSYTLKRADLEKGVIQFTVKYKKSFRFAERFAEADFPLNTLLKQTEVIKALALLRRK